MKSGIPRVSVGLPVYNGERFLSQAIESILGQRFTDFELIISDNASQDGTRAICERYTLQDRRVIYLRNERNLGATKNFNQVFHAATGEYFRWAGSDDICAPDLLGKCVRVLDRHPEVVLCYPKTQLIDLNGDFVDMAEDRLELDSQDVVMRFAGTLSPMKLCHNPIYGVMRREVLAKTRLMGHHLAPDRCLLAELVLHGLFREIPEKLFMRRKHENNIGTTRKHLSFINPRFKDEVVFPEWRVAREHFRSVRRVPLNSFTKMRLRREILRWMFSRRIVFVAQVLVGCRNYGEKWLGELLKVRAPGRIYN